jgi:hypothetical protein
VNSSTSSFNPKKFVIVFTILFAMLGLTASFFRTYFYYTGDLLTEAEAVGLQQSATGDCNYQSAGGKNYFAYKKELNRALKPEIVSLGSSLAAMFSQNMFTAKFANLGLTIEDMNDISSAIHQLTEVHKPKHVIFIVDTWWFNPNWRPASQPIDPNDSIKPNDSAVLRSLVSQTIKRPSLLSFMSEIGSGPHCPIGALAKLYPSGFAKDGSRNYGERLIIPPAQQEDYQFHDTLARIDKGQRRFEYASAIDEKLMMRFSKALADLESQNIGYTLVVAPLAPAVHDRIVNSGKYSFIELLFQRFKRENLVIQNFFDPKTLGLTDCDFVDGIHLGDSGTAKLLKATALNDPRMESFINGVEIQRLAGKKGQSMVLVSERYNIRENDFLGLGCKKP